MDSVRRFALALCTCAIAACGGGGGGGDAGSGGPSGGISISPTALQFNVEGAQPAAQTVTVTFSGAGVVAGFAPGQTQPPWLFVSAPSVSTSPVQFTITVSPGSLAFGTYTASLRFATGNSISNPTGFVDLPITFTYREAFSVMPSPFPFAFEEFAGNPDPPTPAAGELQIRGAGIPWSVNADQPWITLSPASGTGAATVAVGIARATLAPGTYQGEVRVVDDRNGNTRRFTVSYNVAAAQLVLDRPSVDFDIGPQTTASGTAVDVLLSDQLQGRSTSGDLSWLIASSAPWLQLSATSGRTAPATPLTVSIPRSQLEVLPPGFRATSLTITATDRAGQITQVNVPVNLNLRLPFVRTVIPRVIEPGAVAPVRITTEKLTIDDLANLRVGDQTPQSVPQHAPAEFELRFDAPALPAGAHEVRFDNALGLRRSNATLVAKALVTPSTSEIVSSGSKSKLLYDRQRDRLYAIDPGDAEIERFQWNGVSWDALAAVPVAGIVDAELERSGNALVVVTDDEVLRLPFEPDNAALASLHTLADRSCARSFFRAGVPDDDQAMISHTLDLGDSCSDAGAVPVLFDLIRREAVTAPLPQLPPYTIFASSNGFRYFVGASEPHPLAPLGQFDSPFDSYSQIRLFPETVRALDVDSTGLNLLFNNDTIYDGVQDVDRAVPPGRVSRISGDGTRVYAYLHPTGGSRRIAVLEVPPVLSSPVSEIASVPVTVDLGDAQRDPDLAIPDTLAMALGPDDQVLFISGPQRIAVIALP